MASELETLDSILGVVTEIEANTRNGYDSVVGGNDLVASLDDPYVRPANAKAVRTVITNLGPYPVDITEEGVLVAKSVQPMETWVSPESGAGEIEVTTGGAGSTISVATYILN